MVARTARRLGNHAFKTQLAQVQFINEDVDHPNRIVLRHVVVKILGKQDTLPTVFTLNEALHLSSRSITSRNPSRLGSFHTASTQPSRQPRVEALRRRSANSGHSRPAGKRTFSPGQKTVLILPGFRSAKRRQRP